MARNTQTARAERQAGTQFVEFSFVVVADHTDPSILNPDFLRYNEIVDADLPLRDPVISTPVFSQVLFEGDIGIKVEPHRFIFEQKGQALDMDDCVVPELVKRFLKVVSGVPCNAVGTNVKSFRPLRDKLIHDVSGFLVNGGKWMSFSGVLPDIHLKAYYNFDDRRISFEVGRIVGGGQGGTPMNGLLFQGNIHRNIPKISQKERIERVSSILSVWKKDIHEFNDLVAKFGK